MHEAPPGAYVTSGTRVHARASLTTPPVCAQKCDRKHPCSLCTTRGVAHLCRWETVPLARPTPARPPPSALKEAAAAPTESPSLVADLKQRIAALERELEQMRERCSSPSAGRSTSSGALSTPAFSDIVCPYSPPLSADVPHDASRSPVQRLAERDLRARAEECSVYFPLDEEAYEATSMLAQLSLAHPGEFLGRGSLICALHAVSLKCCDVALRPC